MTGTRRSAAGTCALPRYFLALLGVYCVASLIHFAHNAEFVTEYPNLPFWLTRSKVYLAWLALTACGAAGVVLLGTGFRASGLAVIVVYAVFGFAGLDHYWVAPVSAHSFAMNATIWFEVAAAALLLIAALRLMLRSTRASSAAISE